MIQGLLPALLSTLDSKKVPAYAGLIMVKTTRIILSAILFSLLFTISSVAAERHIILTSQDLSPLGCYDKNGTYDGIAVRVVRHALEKMDVAYEILVYPWARAQVEVKAGRADAFFAGSKNAERESYAVMSAIIADQKWVWYQLMENPRNPADPDFKEKAAVGSYVGANMLDWLKQNNYNVKAEPGDTEALFKMLLLKRVDAILANNYVAEEIIAQKNLAGRLKSTVQQEQPLGVYFSKTFLAKNPGFLEEFNAGVADYFSKK